MDPDQVDQHEGEEYGEADFSRGVSPTGGEQFDQDEYHDVGVHDVIQPRGEVVVEDFGEDQFTVYGV